MEAGKMAGTVLLSVAEVVKVFPSGGTALRALDGVSLEVRRGEMVVVTGASGSGKSTLLLACGLMQGVDAGAVHYGETRVSGLSRDGRRRWRQRWVGFVFQEFHLIPYLTVRQNIGVSCLAAGVELDEVRLIQLLERLQLAGRAQTQAAHLSTGEKQRTALARALITRPQCILADEPTGNLDDANTGFVIDALREFSQEGAVLLVTHESRVAAMADRRLLLDRGRIVEG